MSSIRVTLTAFLLAAAGIAQASEISEAPKPSSTRERIAVIAEARWAQPSNELYDGTAAMKPAAVSTKTREQVRMEAAATKAVQQQLALGDYLGGM